MDLATLRQQRLRVQGVREPAAASAPEVVERFVAVQSQEFVPAQWGLAMRVRSEHRPDAASVAASIDRGEILRTHVLRPTWHFVSPADAGWLIELSAERVHRLNATYYRRVGLEGEAATRGLDVVARALEGGHRTRAQLTAALDEAGSPMAGLAFGYLLMLAELERVAISGANVGKQRTYAAFDERVPASAPKPRDEALAELAERFIGSRGPVNERDFAAWSGFTLGDARQAFAGAAERSGGRITTVDVDGETQWLDASTLSDAASPDRGTDRVDLLQAYDEYIMGYAAPRAYLQSPERAAPVGAEFPLHALMIGGVMCGRWAPVVNAKRAVVRIVPWRTFSPAEERSLAASVAELERFLGRPVTVERDAPVAAGAPGASAGSS